MAITYMYFWLAGHKKPGLQTRAYTIHLKMFFPEQIILLRNSNVWEK